MKPTKPVEQIETLFAQAVQRAQYASRYISLARTIATSSRIHIPIHLHRLYCKTCNNLLGQVRIRNKTIVKKCAVCGKIRRKVINTKIA